MAWPLLDFHRRATDRMLFVRGKPRLGDVYGGLDGPFRVEAGIQPRDPPAGW